MGINEKDLTRLIEDIRDERVEYFRTLQNAANIAALKFLNQRVSILEELDNDDESPFNVTTYFFDVMLSMAIGKVSGVVLSKITNELVESIIGVRHKVLWVSVTKHGFKYSIVKDPQGKLVPFQGQVIKKMSSVLSSIAHKKWKNSADRPSVLWKANSAAVNDDVITMIMGSKEPSYSSSIGNITTFDTNAIDITAAVHTATSSQVMFEKKFFNYLKAQVDSTKHSEIFISAMVDLVSKNRSVSQLDIQKMLDRYARHFELCMWVVHFEDLSELVSIPGQPTAVLRKRMGRNTLLKQPNGTSNFGSVIIHKPKIVDYLSKNMIDPNSNAGKSIFEHFIDGKIKSGNLNPDAIALRRRANFLEITPKKRPHLYREMVFFALLPVLYEAQRQAKRILR